MLNALRHHCAGHTPNVSTGNTAALVLNALRHHCAGHESENELDSSDTDMC